MKGRNRSVVMVLAGGKGQRLLPLTCHRAKPAVPFGGRYRIIDFVLSNLVNSGYKRIWVLTQYMATSLIRHLGRTWNISSPGEFLEVVPAQMRSGEHWYRGTADSVWQNLNLLVDAHADNVAVFGGDHVYKCDVAHMEEFHLESGADLTIAAYPATIEEARGNFGVFEVDGQGKLLGFEEKPREPRPMPGRPGYCLVSMGNYFFKAESLRDALVDEQREAGAAWDFGKSIIPRMINGGYKVAIYDFGTNHVDGDPPDAQPYWRDVGTLDSYFDANMDVRSTVPTINLYNFRWRIRTAQRNFPPARIVRHPSSSSVGSIVDSLVCEGTIVCSARLVDVLAGYDCYFHADCDVENAVILSGCDIGSGSRLRNVLLDKNCSIDQDTVIGEDPETDRQRFPFITERGRIVLPKGTHVPPKGPIQLAHDIVEHLEHDPATAPLMKEWAERYVVSSRSRHSHDSVGPRFRRFSRRLVE